jgi:hypothetical protein
MVSAVPAKRVSFTRGRSTRVATLPRTPTWGRTIPKRTSTWGRSRSPNPHVGAKPLLGPHVGAKPFLHGPTWGRSHSSTDPRGGEAIPPRTHVGAKPFLHGPHVGVEPFLYGPPRGGIARDEGGDGDIYGFVPGDLMVRREPGKVGGIVAVRGQHEDLHAISSFAFLRAERHERRTRPEDLPRPRQVRVRVNAPCREVLAFDKRYLPDAPHEHAVLHRARPAGKSLARARSPP